MQANISRYKCVQTMNIKHQHLQTTHSKFLEIFFYMQLIFLALYNYGNGSISRTGNVQVYTQLTYSTQSQFSEYDALEATKQIFVYSINLCKRLKMIFITTGNHFHLYLVLMPSSLRIVFSWRVTNHKLVNGNNFWHSRLVGNTCPNNYFHANNSRIAQACSSLTSQSGCSAPAIL